MKKLLFYSDQVIAANSRLDERLFTLSGNSNPSVGYIPSESDPARYRPFYEGRQAYYRLRGITNVRLFSLDHDYDSAQIDALLGCDILHLSGGDTFAFLRLLGQRQLLPHLRAFADAGGVIVGTSAGAILMTPDIGINNLYGKEPPAGLPDLSALALVDFEFFAHLTEQNLPALQEYSRSKPFTVIYGCPDGDGIVVMDDRLEFIGDVLKLIGGITSHANA